MYISGNKYDLIYEAVAQIPQGRVSTYGDVAWMAGLPGRARMVGYALHALRGDRCVPWHRVVNAKGELSIRRKGAEHKAEQRALLEDEGIEFDAKGRINLKRYGWMAK